MDAKLHAIITCKVEDCCSGLTYCYNKEFIFFHCLIVLYYRTVNHSSLYNNSAHPPICVQYFLTFNDLILYGTSSSARNFFFRLVWNVFLAGVITALTLLAPYLCIGLSFMQCTFICLCSNLNFSF